MQRHRFDPISLIAGLIFLLIASLFALPATPWEFLIREVRLDWVFPVILIVGGLALLVPLVRSRDEPDVDEPTE